MLNMDEMRITSVVASLKALDPVKHLKLPCLEQLTRLGMLKISTAHINLLHMCANAIVSSVPSS